MATKDIGILSPGNSMLRRHEAKGKWKLQTEIKIANQLTLRWVFVTSRTVGWYVCVWVGLVAGGHMRPLCPSLDSWLHLGQLFLMNDRTGWRAEQVVGVLASSFPPWPKDTPLEWCSNPVRSPYPWWWPGAPASHLWSKCSVGSSAHGWENVLKHTLWAT